MKATEQYFPVVHVCLFIIIQHNEMNEILLCDQFQTAILSCGTIILFFSIIKLYDLNS